MSETNTSYMVDGVISEARGQRERPYDLRWGGLDYIKQSFGLNAPVIKAAWRRGWIRARQGNWESDAKRTQTVYCFEDIHTWLERCAHCVTADYAKVWWTDNEVARLEAITPEGPYMRPTAEPRVAVRADGYPRLIRLNKKKVAGDKR